MLTVSDIAAAVKKVAEKYNIKETMLFGSYANGTNTASSDVDLLVDFGSEYVSLLTLSLLKIEIEEILNAKSTIRQKTTDYIPVNINSETPKVRKEPIVEVPSQETVVTRPRKRKDKR